MKVKVAQSCPTLYSPWNSPGQNAGVGSRSLLQGIFPAQGLNPVLPHCRWILYQLSHKGSPRILEWVAYPFSSGSSWPRNQTGVSCIAGGFFSSWATRKWYLCHGTYVRKWYLKPSQTFYNFMLKGNVLLFWSTDRVWTAAINWMCTPGLDPKLSLCGCFPMSFLDVPHFADEETEAWKGSVAYPG